MENVYKASRWFYFTLSFEPHSPSALSALRDLGMDLNKEPETRGFDSFVLDLSMRNSIHSDTISSGKSPRKTPKMLSKAKKSSFYEERKATGRDQENDESDFTDENTNWINEYFSLLSGDVSDHAEELEDIFSDDPDLKLSQALMYLERRHLGAAKTIISEQVSQFSNFKLMLI